MRWYTKIIYVDQQTGEIINKKEVEENYIITKTKKEYEITHSYGAANKGGTRTREEQGTIKYTKLCTRDGKQGRLWK